MNESQRSEIKENGTCNSSLLNVPQSRPPQVRIQVPVVEACTQTEQWLPFPLSPQEAVQVPYPYSGFQLPPQWQPKPGETFLVSSEEKEVTMEKAYLSANNSSVNSAKGPAGYSGVEGFQVKSAPSQRSQFSGYLIALRPWSFPASITPVALGSCLAYKALGVFSVYIFFMTVITALCVHAAGNLVNTYFDFVRGVDTKKSDDRTLVDSILQPNDVVRLGAVVYIAGCVGFVIVNILSEAKMEHLALIYFCGLSSSFLYTGGLGLKYIAMGDILIVLTFGPLTVVFSYLSQTGQLSLVPLMYAIPLALNTEAILHCNNTRDMEGDKLAGAITMAILLGRSGSYALFCFLLFIPYLLFITVGIHFSPWILLPAASIFFAFRLEKEFRRGNLTTLPQSVARLNLVIGVLYIASLYLSNWSSLPSMTQLG
ncbi:ubiA prenyltransferase domain-containing protein 1 [Aplysia californica]|uniref:UbiA prenyltransferase domain-containing protein 1 n=1 Tax=Aplysia californica TaxID=6500 RepID=A0ABM0K3G6_APLCA|nr:ubiA prenyltransferase domain-containing protein 1 [Aplysia californica]